MRYLLAIYMNGDGVEQPSEADARAMNDAWFAYTHELQRAGRMVAGEALQPVATATTVRLAAPGTPVVSDGPFAETKEQLGGFYLVDVADRDEAAKWAAKMPHLAHGGSVEVRPLMEFDT